jgi:hypothetical protein
MQWLLPALAGWLAGLLSALAATEYAAWRQRGAEKRDVARILLAETAANKQRLHGALTLISKVDNEHPARITAPRFARSGFLASIGSLALLPEPVVERLLFFYGLLDDLDHTLQEWRWLDTQYPVGGKRRVDTTPAVLQLRDDFRTYCKEAMAVADDVLSQLEKVR